MSENYDTVLESLNLLSDTFPTGENKIIVETYDNPNMIKTLRFQGWEEVPHDAHTYFLLTAPDEIMELRNGIGQNKTVTRPNKRKNGVLESSLFFKDRGMQFSEDNQNRLRNGLKPETESVYVKARPRENEYGFQPGWDGLNVLRISSHHPHQPKVNDRYFISVANDSRTWCWLYNYLPGILNDNSMPGQRFWHEIKNKMDSAGLEGYLQKRRAELQKKKPPLPQSDENLFSKTFNLFGGSAVKFVDLDEIPMKFVPSWTWNEFMNGTVLKTPDYVHPTKYAVFPPGYGRIY